MKEIPVWAIVLIAICALILVYLFLKLLIPIAIVAGLIFGGIWLYNNKLKGK